MKAIVAGGAGFVGSHLCEALMARGCSVIAVDNLLSGDRRNVEALIGKPGFQLIHADLIDGPALPAADAVFQLASPASPVSYRRNAIETMRVNSEGTYHLLRHSELCGARFLMASTSEVYGDPLQHPQTEEYWGNVNPVGVRACYDEGKRFAETLTMEFYRSFDLNARIIRIFNTYGPRNQPDDGRVVPAFCTSALRGAPLTIYGDGTQTRSFCYVSDLVEGICRAMFGDGTQGEVINLGNPAEFTMIELAKLINRLAGQKSEIVHVPLPEGRTDDPARRLPDISKANRLLGWEPVVPPEQGLVDTLDYFRRLNAGPA